MYRLNASKQTYPVSLSADATCEVVGSLTLRNFKLKQAPGLLGSHRRQLDQQSILSSLELQPPQKQLLSARRHQVAACWPARLQGVLSRAVPCLAVSGRPVGRGRRFWPIHCSRH